MSREDRRPLSQVPEDSANTYMHSFASYPPSPQGSFTLHPPYNPTDQNFFDTFVYSPNEADPYLSDPLLSDWAHYQPTYVQNFGVTDTEYPFLSTMHYPEPSMRYPELSMHHPEFNVHHPVLPLYSPCPLAAQFVPLLPDPSAAIPAQFVPLLPDPSAADNQALPYNPDQLTVCDLSAIPNFSECYPEFFTNTEYCEEVYVPQPAVASDVTESSVGNAPFQVQQAPPHPSPRARTRTPPTVRGNAFVPSDSDILSSHEKKRLYVECLEHYVQYLHQLFAWIQVQPVPLERVSSYRGLTSRSMRTILIHLGKSADIIHGLTTQQEDKFKDLRMRKVLSGMYAQISESRNTTVSPSSDTDLDADVEFLAYP